MPVRRKEGRKIANHLLSHGERLVVELLDKFCCHLVSIIRVGVDAFFLQEIDLNGHCANTLFGLVKRI